MVKVYRMQGKNGYRQTTVTIFSQIKIYLSYTMGYNVYTINLGTKYNYIGCTLHTGLYKGIEIYDSNGDILNTVKEKVGI